MAKNVKTKKETNAAEESAAKKVVLVGTYKGDVLTKWREWYCYPVRAADKISEADAAKINTLWLFKGAAEQKSYKAEFVGVKTRAELVRDYGYPAEGKAHGEKYLLFRKTLAYRLADTPPEEAERVFVRTADFARSPKVCKQLKAYLESPDRVDPDLAKRLPSIVTKVPRENLCVCETAMQLELGLETVNISAETSVHLSAAKAMQMLSLSRHSYDKLIAKGIITRHQVGEDSYFLMSDIENAKSSSEYIDLKTGIVDRRNTLNDLTGKDWIPETKSYLYQKGLGADSSEAQIERLHPAPYSFQDIGHLIRFFTKRGMRVLDPFGGVGSTAKACEVDGRVCTSIELSSKWHELSKQRLEVEVGKGASLKHTFVNGDSCQVLPGMQSNSVDFVVTSPPYWGILNKQDQKVKRDRVSQNLDTKYSEDKRDLGNVRDYKTFLDILVERVFLQCARVLSCKKYMAIVVSDFRDKNRFVSFHSDLIMLLNNTEIPGGGVLRLQGTKILIQNHKSLLPYGYPFAYVENIHHQYILIFRKDV